MPNDWFQFKQFKIEQDLCAMKVSTDACIQGAWAADKLLSLAAGPMRILDIGAGTGLLSLMLAQLHPDAHIDAVELNAEACAQAEKNFKASPWAQRLIAYNAGLAGFAGQAGQGRYDFMICNPPFFHNHLQAAQKARNDARHSVSLSKEALAAAMGLLLRETGYCCVMYPQTEWQGWLDVCKGNGLYPVASVGVRPKATAMINRMIGLFSPKNNRLHPPETLVIYEDDRTYTDRFRALLSPYYLAL